MNTLQKGKFKYTNIFVPEDDEHTSPFHVVSHKISNSVAETAKLLVAAAALHLRVVVVVVAAAAFVVSAEVFAESKKGGSAASEDCLDI